MKNHATRRSFLAAGLSFPAVSLSAAALGKAAPSILSSQDSQAPELQYRVLGKTGLKVTTVGFGCMITSDPTVIQRAVDAGINYFDTSRNYQRGNNERMVGAALKGRRKDVHLSTKADTKTREGVLAELETSLKELGTDYVDVWYLHGVRSPSDFNDDLCGALDQAKKDGKARFTGVSLHSGHKELLPVLTENPHMDVILMSYNFTMDPSIGPLVQKAADAGKGIIAMKVMAGGLRRLKPGDEMYDKFKTAGTMLAALKWAIREPVVHTSIPSMTGIDQLQENLKAMAEPFGTSDEKLLASHLDYLRPLYCRMCGQCDGTCPKGLPVSDVLRYLTYAEGYGQYELGRENFLSMSGELQQVRCGDCESCPVQCPHGVQVVNRLSRAQELFA
ncbi:MAG: aldo/keto reductase [Acidobacteriota bacterium]